MVFFFMQVHLVLLEERVCSTKILIVIGRKSVQFCLQYGFLLLFAKIDFPFQWKNLVQPSFLASFFEKNYLPYYIIVSIRSYSTGYISVNVWKVGYLKAVTRLHRIWTWKDFIPKESIWCSKSKIMQVSIRPSRDNCVCEIPQGPIHTPG